MVREPEHARAVDTVYAAAIEPVKRPSALDSLRRLCRAESASYNLQHITNGTGTRTAIGYDLAHQPRYFDGFAARNELFTGQAHAARTAWEAALDTLRCGVVMLDQCGHIVFANQAARQFDTRHDGLVLRREGVSAPLPLALWRMPSEWLQTAITTASATAPIWHRRGGTCPTRYPSTSSRYHSNRRGSFQAFPSVARPARRSREGCNISM